MGSRWKGGKLIYALYCSKASYIGKYVVKGVVKDTLLHKNWCYIYKPLILRSYCYSTAVLKLKDTVATSYTSYSKNSSNSSHIEGNNLFVFYSV